MNIKSILRAIAVEIRKQAKAKGQVLTPPHAMEAAVKLLQWEETDEFDWEYILAPKKPVIKYSRFAQKKQAKKKK